MAFNLQVDFSGPCLYVLHPTDKTQVAILIPDGRKRTPGNDYHLDDELAEAHVGFIRVNLADLRTTGLILPQGSTEEEPAYELIHRFEGEVLEFEGVEPAVLTSVTLAVPDFAKFAPTLELLPDLFGETPPPALLMRCILKGGSIESSPRLQKWKFSRLLAGNLPEYKDGFAPFVTWKRTITDDRLSIRLSSFDGTRETRFVLGPFQDGETVTVEVANLCAHNPLEWKDLPPRMVSETDEDFKWLYRLLEPAGSTYPDVLKGAPLPAPRLGRGSKRIVTGDEDCMGAQITADWPVETITTHGTEAAGDSSR